MAAITWPDVVAIAAELSTVGAATQALILDLANQYFNVGMFGGEDSAKLKMARIYLAAHMATLGSQGGNAVAGPVISESMGGLSRSYALLAAQSKWSGSAYGDLLTMLVRSSGARIPVVP